MQTFFLVILPGIGLTVLELLPVALAAVLVAKWGVPYARRQVARRRRYDEETQRAVEYRESARQVIAQLVVQMGVDPRLDESIPDGLQEQILSVNNKGFE